MTFLALSTAAAWERLQQEQMLQDATELVADEAEDPAARRLTAQDKRRLQAAFSRDFAAQLQQQECPAEQQVRTWLRQQLGISQLSYDDGYDDDAAPYGDQHAQGAASGSQQQQQQRQQPPPGRAPTHTSSRPLTAARWQQQGRWCAQVQPQQQRTDEPQLCGPLWHQHTEGPGGSSGSNRGHGGGKGRDYRGGQQQRRRQQRQQSNSP